MSKKLEINPEYDQGEPSVQLLLTLGEQVQEVLHQHKYTNIWVAEDGIICGEQRIEAARQSDYRRDIKLNKARNYAGQEVLISSQQGVNIGELTARSENQEQELTIILGQQLVRVLESQGMWRIRIGKDNTVHAHQSYWGAKYKLSNVQLTTNEQGEVSISSKVEYSWNPNVI